MFVLPEIVRSPTLAETAKQRIQEAIWSGQLAPGVHLVEAALSEQFQISRGPFREALRTLAAEGLVEFYPGRGAFVVDPTPDQMQDMIILRAMLGGMAARYATAAGDETVFRKLSASLSRMRSAADRDDEKAFFDEHWRFYEVLHRAANEFIFRSWQSLYGLINVYVRRLGRPYLTLHHILGDQEVFVRLFKAGDADEAEAVVRSEMLRIGFVVLDRPIPPMLYSYVTRRVHDGGRVAAYDPATDVGHRAKSKKTRTRSGEETWENVGTSANSGRARRTG